MGHALRRDDRVVFLVDEDTGPSAAEGITLAGGIARLVTDVFGNGAKDPDFLPRIPSHAHALVTIDIGQKRKAEERAIIMALGFDAGTFIIRCGHTSRDRRRELLRFHYHRMVKIVHTRAMPFIAHITEEDVVCKEGGAKLSTAARTKPAM